MSAVIASPAYCYGRGEMPGSLVRWVRPDTSLRKKRAVGLILLAGLLTLFVLFGRIPTLDGARAELLFAAGSARIECFQGECVDTSDKSDRPPLLSRSWNFAESYLKLIALGITFGLLVVGLVEAFIFPRRRTAGSSAAGAGLIGRALQAIAGRHGLAVQIGDAGVPAPSHLNVSVLLLAAMLFAPMLAGGTIVLSVVGVLIAGPLAAMGGGRRWLWGIHVPVDAGELTESSWRRPLTNGLRDWAEATLRHLVRLGPLIVLAAFLSGLAVQWLDPETVSSFLGDSAQGILVAATLGLLISVPLMMVIPLVAALLLIGMGTAPAATLLFAAATGGLVRFWRLPGIVPRRAIVAFGTTTWALGTVGGLAILGVGLLIYGSEFGSRAEAEALNIDASSPRVFATYTEGGPLLYRLPPELALKIYGEPILRADDLAPRIAGDYAGTFRSDGSDVNGEIRLTLRQAGFAVSGEVEMRGTANWGGVFTGVSDADRFNFSLDVDSPDISGVVEFTGELPENRSGFALTGTLIGTYYVLSNGERGKWEASLVGG